MNVIDLRSGPKLNELEIGSNITVTTNGEVRTHPTVTIDAMDMSTDIKKIYDTSKNFCKPSEVVLTYHEKIGWLTITTELEHHNLPT